MTQVHEKLFFYTSSNVLTDFYAFWCAESKCSNQFAPSRTNFLLHWVILSHRVKNTVHFTVVITSKFLFQNLVN